MARHIRVEPFCVLCRSTLPFQWQTLRRLPCQSTGEDCNDEWSTDFICFFESQPHNIRYEKGGCHAFRANLANSNWANIGELSRKFALEDKFSFCFDHSRCSLCDPQDTLNFAHATCFQLAQQLVPGFSIYSLRLFLGKTRPLLSWPHAASLADLRPHVGIGPDSRKLAPTCLAQLVQQTQRRLPIEHQKLIFDHVSGLFQCLTSCWSILSEYGSFLHELTTVTVRKQAVNPLRTYPSAKRIGANFVDILGEICLNCLALDDESEFAQHVIITNDDVRGFQFSLGTYGVVAFRVLYENGNSSSWLGRSRRMWTTTIELSDLKKVRTHSDGFKLVRIDTGEVEHESMSSLATKPPQYFWDYDEIPSKQRRHLLADMDTLGAKIFSNPGARLVKKIDLRHTKLQSLTIACSQLSITDIRINGHTKMSLGSLPQHSSFITYFLYPEESIESVHLVICGKQRPLIGFGPYLLIRTSQGRTLYYGTFLTFSSPPVNVVSFDVKETEKIVGLSYDPTNSQTRKLQTLGITLEPEAGHSAKDSPIFSIPKVNAIDPFSFLSYTSTSAFLSKATLLNVKTLKIQRISKRCVGLLIERHTGIPEALGQWDPFNEDTSLLYDEQMGSLTALTFLYSHPYPEIRARPRFQEPTERDQRALGKRRYVTDILLADSDPVRWNGRGFTWSDLSSELAWWFTASFDCIEPWTGTSTEIDITDPKFTRELVE